MTPIASVAATPYSPEHGTGTAQPSQATSHPAIPQDAVHISLEAIKRIQEQHRAAELALGSALELQRRILNILA